MTLTTATLIISLGIGFFTLLPWFFTGVRRYSRSLLLAGTVVLLGFVLFDLVPEMVEIGGVTSLLLMGASWAFFTWLHAYQSGSHETHVGSLHDSQEHKAHHGVTFLLGSMALHCFAGGMLLVTSYAVSEGLALAVFLSLVAHKGFEAISMSSLLIERIHSRKHLYSCAAIYALSFPLGVAFTAWGQKLSADLLSAARIEQIAMLITSLAVGSLFGCLLQDFLLPSLRELRGFKVSKNTAPYLRAG